MKCPDWLAWSLLSVAVGFCLIAWWMVVNELLKAGYIL